jgi:hypothetical protein
MADSTNIFRQIIDTADYHAPGVYDALTKYDRLSTTDDEVAAEFVPISPVERTGRNPKLFVIGLLPPAVNLSDKKLDRSASVAAQSGSFPVDGPARAGKATSPVDEFVSPDAETPTIPEGPGGLKNGSYHGRGAKLGDQFWVDFTAMCDRLKVDPGAMAVVMRNESGFNTSAVAVRNGKVTAKGLNQIAPDTAKKLGIPPEEYERFGKLSAERQLFWAEKYFKSNGVRGMSAAQLAARNLGDAYARTNPGGVLYASAAYQASHGGYGAFRDGGVGGKQDLAYQANNIVDTKYGDGDGAISREDVEAWTTKAGSPFAAEITKAQNARRLGARSTSTDRQNVAEGQGSKAWAKDGSKDAKGAAKDINKQAGTSLKVPTLGQRFQAAQESVRKALQAAIEQMAKMPPLRLLVNPESFSMSAEKIVSDGNYGRNGPIVEHWGDGQERIEGSGKVAAFFAMDAFNATGPGLTRTARAGSLSFQNLMSLYLLYKSNGALWMKEFLDNRTENHSLMSLIGSIYIYYDNTLYVGSFDNFTITESDTAPYTLEYSFSFVARAWFLLDSTEQQLLDSAKRLRSVNPVQTVSLNEGPEGYEVVQPTFSTDPVLTDIISRAQAIFNRDRGQ